MRKRPRCRKAQGTFEYVLLLAGVLLIVVLAIVLLRGGIFAGGAKDVALQSCARALAQRMDCYGPSGNIDPTLPLVQEKLPEACLAYQTDYHLTLSTCGDVFGGIVVQPPGTQIEVAREDNKTGASGLVAPSVEPPLVFSIKFSPGWNLVSTPVALSQNIECAAYPCPPKQLVSVKSTICDRTGASAWRLDSASQAYAKIDLLTRPVEVDAQEAYWVYAPEACEAVFNGDAATTLSEWTLHAGWNSIAAQDAELLFDSIKNDCVVESGPWAWNPATLDYLESPSLTPGSGFFVKVANDCILASAPSALPAA